MPANVISRFLRYVSFGTTSDSASHTVPTTESQKVLGEAIAEELRAMGLTDAEMDGQGYVYATLPATPDCADLPAVSFIAHMDTSPDVSGEGVNPRIVSYAGGDIPLVNGECLSAAAFPNLARYVGQELIVTDGTTLLGADDKAGVAEIVTACAYLLAHPELWTNFSKFKESIMY